MKDRKKKADENPPAQSQSTQSEYARIRDMINRKKVRKKKDSDEQDSEETISDDSNQSDL